MTPAIRAMSLAATAMVVVISRRWLTAPDTSGNPRLLQPEDWVTPTEWNWITNCASRLRCSCPTFGNSAGLGGLDAMCE